MLLLLQWLALLLMWYLYYGFAKVLRSQVEVWGDGRTGQYEAGKKLIPEQIYITFSHLADVLSKATYICIHILHLH